MDTKQMKDGLDSILARTKTKTIESFQKISEFEKIYFIGTPKELEEYRKENPSDKSDRTPMRHMVAESVTGTLTSAFCLPVGLYLMADSVTRFLGEDVGIIGRGRQLKKFLKKRYKM